MGDPTGFKDIPRQPPPRRGTQERIRDYNEFVLHWTEEEARAQGARCMDCGIPFCHKGCPLGNLIPDWNELVYKGQWQRALKALHATNNFPEFTGRICPAPCEASCTLSINQEPVTIEYIEKAIADRGWEEGWIKPQPPAQRTGKKVAVVGSGPSGLAAAQQLNRAGHSVTVFERENYIGGLLRLGIPDFKLDKHLVERRVQQMRDEGVTFKTGVYVGRNYPVEDLRSEFDAVLLCIGSTVPRDLPVPGRELRGIHFAMEYLTQQNKIIAGEEFPEHERITAEGKRVVILGGGDTG
ncbi:MAG TPA: glutamate synthase subunit beta, partial [Dehalococcoidia bacterium]|nr:glutamate synthase subunit beta [Dehalococcoidia bacterium]